VEADTLGISDVLALARGVELSAAERSALCLADPARPYGRRVIFNHPRLEAMVATWTAGAECLPHDHGGAIGVVKVLSGRSLHSIYQVDPAGLRLRRAERAPAGSLIPVGPDLVHAMGDDRADEPLVTLHIYSHSIDHMIVYDTAHMRTLVVDGGCGAWVPGPDQLRLALPGLLSRDRVEAALAALSTP
jgi:hypothetical protein